MGFERFGSLLGAGLGLAVAASFATSSLSFSSISRGPASTTVKLELGVKLQVPDGCEETVDKFRRAFAEYRKSASSRFILDENEPPAVFARKLDEIVEGSPSVCRDVLYRVKLVSSLALHGNFPFSANVGVILRNLLAQDRLTALSPEARASLGEIWQRREKQDYAILAAYDCVGSRVYFDPSLAPLDLGGIAVHEFEHLARDKRFMDDSKFVASLDLKDFLELDEVLAAIRAGYTQIQYELAVNHGWMAGATLVTRSTYTQNGFTDLSLYADDGNLDYLALHREEKTGYRDFLRSLARDPARRARLGAIIDIIGKTYFPQRAPESARVLDLFERLLAENMDVLAPLEGETTILDEFFGRSLENPTSGCLALEEKISKGELGDYLGQHLFNDRKATPAKKGGDGGRPGSKGGDGGRPGSKGGDGGRPGSKGGDGGRPGASVHPCTGGTARP